MVQSHRVRIIYGTLSKSRKAMPIFAVSLRDHTSRLYCYGQNEIRAIIR